MRPLLSIIMPVYNGQAYIEETIKNVLNQTLKNIELIIIDDGSTDNSRDIISLYMNKDSRIKAIFSENHGVSSARNTGISISNGEYIGFIDVDDKIENNMYEKLYTKAIKNSSDLVCCGMILKTDYGDFRISPSKVEINALGKDMIETELYKSYICSDKKCLAECWNKIYKTEIIKQYDIRFDTNMKHGEDFLFNLQFVTNINSATFIPDNLYLYNRKNINSVTKKYMNDMINIAIEIYNMRLNYMRLWNMEKYKINLDKDFLSTIYGCINNEMINLSLNNIKNRFDNIKNIQKNYLIKDTYINLNKAELDILTRLKVYILLNLDYRVLGISMKIIDILKSLIKNLVKHIK